MAIDTTRDLMQALLNGMTATPTLDKLYAWARSVKLDDEFIEDERRFEAQAEAVAEARRADREALDGPDEEVAA